MFSRMIDKNLPHQMGGDSKKVRAVLEVRNILGNEAHVRLTDDRGRLQCARIVLAPKIARGQLVQFVVDERHQEIQRLFVPVADLDKQRCDLATIVKTWRS